MLKIARKSAYFALILKDPGGALLELESTLKLLELRICGEIPRSLSSLGVLKFSGWKSAGCVIGCVIGYNPKRTFFLVANEWTEFDGMIVV